VKRAGTGGGKPREFLKTKEERAPSSEGRRESGERPNNPLGTPTKDATRGTHRRRKKGEAVRKHDLTSRIASKKKGVVMIHWCRNGKKIAKQTKEEKGKKWAARATTRRSWKQLKNAGMKGPAEEYQERYSSGQEGAE